MDRLLASKRADGEHHRNCTWTESYLSDVITWTACGQLEALNVCSACGGAARGGWVEDDYSKLTKTYFDDHIHQCKCSAVQHLGKA